MPTTTTSMDPRQNLFQDSKMPTTTPMQIDTTQPPPNFFSQTSATSPIIPFNPQNPPPLTNSTAFGFISPVSF